MPRPPEIAALTIDEGVPGTTVRTVALGVNLAAADWVLVSGWGVDARGVGMRGAGLELTITVAADAAAGPRAVQAMRAGKAAPGGALFHVRARSSASGAFGIGAQLI